MEVRSVLTTENSIEADSACAELRAHNVKCNTSTGGGGSEILLPYEYTGAQPDIGVIQVLVALEDEDRAKRILDEWLRTL